MNDISTSGWVLSLAATNGNVATWDSGSAQYHFNTAAGSPAGCTSGQLTLDPTSATISPRAGCSATGITKGTQAGFLATSIDSIELASASSLAERFCYWEMTGVSASQRIPAGSAAGNYSLDMTLTVVAI